MENLAAFCVCKTWISKSLNGSWLSSELPAQKANIKCHLSGHRVWLQCRASCAGSRIVTAQLLQVRSQQLPPCQLLTRSWRLAWAAAALTQQLDRANEGTALIKQPPFWFVLYGVGTQGWGVLGIGNVEVKVFPLLFQVSPRLSSSSRRRRCSPGGAGWRGECCLLEWGQAQSHLDQEELENYVKYQT